MDFFKIIRLQLILLCFSSLSFGQIESGKVGAPEKSPEKKKKEEKMARKIENQKKTANYNPVTVLYAGGSLGLGFRTLTENKSYFGEPLGERANEIPRFTGGFTLGMRSQLVNHLYLDFGVSIAKYAEAYDYAEADSSYNYTSDYTYFTIPIKLQYTTGQKVKFIAGAGLQPQMFISYKQEIDWRTKENASGSESIKNGKDFNFFTIATLANAGVEWQFGKTASVFLLPEVRYQLNSSYGKQAPYIHKGIFYGVQVGLSIGLN